MNFISAILFLHYLADFIFQSEWMAKNKSSNIKALGLHIIEYTSIMCLGTIALSTMDPKITTMSAISYSCINGILHFMIDSQTSQLSKQAFTDNKIHKFWCIIGFDQFLHTVLLIATLEIYIN